MPSDVEGPEAKAYIIAKALKERCQRSEPATTQDEHFCCALKAALDDIEGGGGTPDCESRCVGFGAALEKRDLLETLTWLETAILEEFGDLDPDLLLSVLGKLHRCRTLGLAQSGSAEEGSAEHLLVGRSSEMVRVRQKLVSAAKARGPVFLLGESGTGKELAARSVHEASGAEGDLVVVNCATLPQGLMESELFGHRRGAYTGAEHSHGGLVQAAEGCTLFLDEITEMPAHCQAKLLRVLEQRTIRPVGGAEEIPVNVRFVASTNRDPGEAMQAGFLREDIYFRLSVHRIDMPPFRERIEDLDELVALFQKSFADLEGRPPLGLSGDALEALRRFHWPGNVRQLRNTIAYALSHAQGPVIEVSDLPSAIAHGRRRVRATPFEATAEPGSRPTALPTFAEAEERLVLEALLAAEGNKVKAAKMLGISRHRLYDKIKKYQLDR